MAFRRPLYYDSRNESLIQMTNADICAFSCNLISAFSLEMAQVTVVQGGGNLGTLTDTRDTAGGVATSQTTYSRYFPNTGTGTLTFNYDRLNCTSSPFQDSAIPDNGRRYPIYYETRSCSIRAMTQQDVLDTFLPCVSEIVSSRSLGTGSPYKILRTTNSEFGYCLVSDTPVFIDTYPEFKCYGPFGPNGNLTNGGVYPTDVINTDCIINYYLHELNRIDIDKAPLYITERNNLKEFGIADIRERIAPVFKNEYCTNSNLTFEYSLGEIERNSTEYLPMGRAIIDFNAPYRTSGGVDYYHFNLVTRSYGSFIRIDGLETPITSTAADLQSIPNSPGPNPFQSLRNRRNTCFLRLKIT